MVEIKLVIRGECRKCGAMGPFRPTDQCPTGEEHDKKPRTFVDMRVQGIFIPTLRFREYGQMPRTSRRGRSG